DFDAPHTAWCYNKNTPKGNELLATIRSEHLSIINYPDSPTRHGNLAEQDSTPDLTLLEGPTKATSTNTHNKVTRDPTLNKINIHAANYKQFKRPARSLTGETVVRTPTRMIPPPSPTTTCGCDIFTIALSFTSKNYNNQTMHRRRTPIFFILSLIHLSPRRLVQALRDKYFTPMQPAYNDYAARKPRDHSLSEDITLAELKQAVAELRVNTAPVPNRITPQQLRNLTDHDYEHLLALMNESWCSGLLSNECKTA
ncbi:hypothetical protein HPB47_001712, partial [Ixodes persulcatus]